MLLLILASFSLSAFEKPGNSGPLVVNTLDAK